MIPGPDQVSRLLSLYLFTVTSGYTTISSYSWPYTFYTSFQSLQIWGRNGWSTEAIVTSVVQLLEAGHKLGYSI
jgi:hypothetical protein